MCWTPLCVNNINNVNKTLALQQTTVSLKVNINKYPELYVFKI